MRSNLKSVSKINKNGINNTIDATIDAMNIVVRFHMIIASFAFAQITMQK